MVQADFRGFRTIVVGHDGTAPADAALELAEQLAADDATLRVARVVQEPRLALAHGHTRPNLERAAAGLSALELRANARQKISTHALRGHSVPHALAALGRDVNADLIVVGSDRRPGDYRAHKVLGLRLLQSAPCAIAIASADADLAVRHIGVAYDGSPEAELALDAAYGIARHLGAAVTLYFAILPDLRSELASQLVRREAGALLDAAAERAPHGVDPETVVVTGYASSAVVEHGGIVDLLVLGSRRQGPLLSAVMGSTSRAVAVEVECAVLITPPSADGGSGRAG